MEDEETVQDTLRGDAQSYARHNERRSEIDDRLALIAQNGLGEKFIGYVDDSAHRRGFWQGFGFTILVCVIILVLIAVFN